MEALAALGLASNIVQFLDFTWRLTETAAKIQGSSSGATGQVLELGTVYSKLNSLCTSLSVCSQPSEKSDEAKRIQTLFPDQTSLERRRTIDSHTNDLRELASDCLSLCQQLIAIVTNLQACGGTGRKFKSFKAALKTIWNEKKILELEARIRRYQTAIGLHFLPLIREHMSYTNSLLERLREESAALRIEHTGHFDCITGRLDKLYKHLSAIVPRQAIDRLSAQYHGDLSKPMLGATHVFTTKDLSEKDVEKIISDISNLSFSEIEFTTIAREQAFFRSLDFASRRRRFEDIPVAHTQTFDWILDSSDQKRKCEAQDLDSLVEWLRGGKGILWVSGKAGSGKSTLMKYITKHGTTRKGLEAWAGQKKLIVGSHFFWSSGTTQQKSQKGLYRSLLYDFLCACPEQIPRVCGNRWAATKFSAQPDHYDEEWPTDELHAAILKLTRLSDSPAKYCVFIDGCDEYDGDHFELCQLLKELFKSSNTKCCLSSRPWNVFEDAFGASPSSRLNLHLLTQKDILVYTQSRLMEHPRWSVAHFCQDDMNMIVENITQKAQGVFLWVYLVTKSLRDGLTDGDMMHDLQRRFNSLPSNLESFFKHIINTVDKFHHKSMAQLLLTAINARSPLSLSIYRHREYEEEDSEYAINRPINTALYNYPKLVDESCRRRINARCGGLLEVRTEKVEFLHRTVRDFLLTREMHDYLHLEAGCNFRVNLSTLKSYVYDIHYRLVSSSIDMRPVRRCVDTTDQWLWQDGLAYANDALDEDEEGAMLLLDTVQYLYKHTACLVDPSFVNICGTITLVSLFENDILQAGVDRYVAVKLRASGNFFASFLDSPLRIVMSSPMWHQGHINIVKMLLETGSDPNALSREQPQPWHMCLAATLANNFDNEKLTAALKSRLFTHFLKYGARRDVFIHLDTGTRLPSTHFLATLIRLDTSHILAREWLHALNDFFDHDNDLEQTKLQASEALPLLHDCLGNLAKKTPEPSRIRFFAQVIQNLIHKWQSVVSDISMELEQLVLPLQSAFPAATAITLVELIQRPSGQGRCQLSPQPSSALKRSLQGGEQPTAKRMVLE
ncbi:hypothetical protein F5Y18DRAFT_12434 [Xylariaceae sp. FL1019]|nr:hypothetical protein F5Y18DRAFT_12434 [Xylariaceae sp. FL1019]